MTEKGFSNRIITGTWSMVSMFFYCSWYLHLVLGFLDTWNTAQCAILQAVDLGGLLRLMLRKMSLQLNNPPFNFMIHTSPLHSTPSQLPYAHWFLQIVPQLSGIGGFEMGTGCYINPVFPEDAAKVMREVCISS